MKHPRARDRYDVAVVGAGVVGMAHALAAARAGARVALIEARARPVGASVRNFGFITVTGQERTQMWGLARRSRDVWAVLAREAGVRVEQTGLVMTARRAEAVAVLEEFLDTEMGEGCVLQDGAALRAAMPGPRLDQVQAALVSPHELRIEAREAAPRVLDWLADRWSVDIIPSSMVVDVQPGRVRTAHGEVAATHIFVCPGDEVANLYPDLARDMGVRICKLQMMRLAAPGYRLPSPVMSDLGLARYQGYSALASAEALKRRLEAEQDRQLAAGVHLIVAQSADGSLVVGDSHEYGDTPDPFLKTRVDDLIIDEYGQVLGPPPPVIERWAGFYAWSPDRNWFSEAAAPGVHVTVVTCGAGMSTAFAIGEDVVAAALKAPLKAVS